MSDVLRILQNLQTDGDRIRVIRAGAEQGMSRPGVGENQAHRHGVWNFLVSGKGIDEPELWAIVYQQSASD
jgi:hypothetical protein